MVCSTGKTCGGCLAHRFHLANERDKKLDLEATYPSEEDIMNISKETTWREFSKIMGITDEKYREVGVNLTGGVVNAVEICETIFKLPSQFEILNMFEEENKKENVIV